MDLGGARIPSIARFKLGFGGAIVPYTNIVKAHTLLARWASWLQEATVHRVQALRFRRSRKGQLSQARKADEE